MDASTLGDIGIDQALKHPNPNFPIGVLEAQVNDRAVGGAFHCQRLLNTRERAFCFCSRRIAGSGVVGCSHVVGRAIERRNRRDPAGVGRLSRQSLDPIGSIPPPACRRRARVDRFDSEPFDHLLFQIAAVEDLNFRLDGLREEGAVSRVSVPEALPALRPSWSSTAAEVSKTGCRTALVISAIARPIATDRMMMPHVRRTRSRRSKTRGRDRP